MTNENVNMEINKELLNKEMVICKKTIASMYHFQDKEKIAKLDMLNKEICLVVAEFRCQRPECGRTSDLQLHHLIMRKAKEFMDFFRYASQRYYWANQIILCRKCHCLYHTFMQDKMDKDEMGVIADEEIERIKQKYSKCQKSNANTVENAAT